MRNLINYFNEHHGYARMKEIKEAYFQTSEIKKFLTNGTIEKIKPGFYKLSELDDEQINISFIDVCYAVPKGVICLLSALDYYSLTTFNCSQVYLAIPNSVKAPVIDYPPVKIFYFVDRFYLIGIEEIKTKHGVVRIYNREKTICDMFRYRNKIGLDLGIEALKLYFKTKNVDIPKLIEYANICQVKTILLPYLKVLV